jgi:signal transduction histidine kinase
VKLAYQVLMERHIEVRTEIADGLPSLSVDRVHLQQVLLNLLMNAIEAMRDLPQERRLMTIGAYHGQLDGRPMVFITFHDLGCGFKPQDSERLFDPFYSTKPHGLGMGLRISRSIVEAHGGRLWATSNAGPGATFHCALPAGKKGQ